MVLKGGGGRGQVVAHTKRAGVSTIISCNVVCIVCGGSQFHKVLFLISQTPGCGPRPYTRSWGTTISQEIFDIRIIEIGSGIEAG